MLYLLVFKAFSDAEANTLRLEMLYAPPRLRGNPQPTEFRFGYVLERFWVWLKRSIWLFLRMFVLIESERRSKSFCLKHNLVDPRFTPVGFCSRNRSRGR